MKPSMASYNALNLVQQYPSVNVLVHVLSQGHWQGPLVKVSSSLRNRHFQPFVLSHFYAVRVPVATSAASQVVKGGGMTNTPLSSRCL